MICKNCGASLDDNARFCTVCGASTVENANDAGSTGVGASTPVNSKSAWMTSPNPSFEYDSLGTDSYRTPEAVFPEGYDPQTAAEEDLRKAKAAYKAARKRAGKSNAPKVLAIILALLVSSGASGFLVWRTMREQMVSAEAAHHTEESVATGEASEAGSAQQGKAPSQQGSELAAQKAETSDPEAETESVPSVQGKTGQESRGAMDGFAVEVADAAEDSTQDPLLGVWRGVLQKPSNGRYYCFGGQALPPTLTITEIDETGRMKANLSMCFHNHEEMDNPADSNPGDTLLETGDLTLFLDDDSFSYELALEGDYEGDSITINGNVYEEDGKTKLKLSLESYYEPNWDRQTDVYVLTKEQ